MNHDWHDPAAPPPVPPHPIDAAALELPSTEHAPQPYPFWTYLDLGFFLAIMVAAIVVASIAAAASAYFFPSMVAIVLIAQFIVYAAGIFALWFVIRKRYGRPFWESLRWGGYSGSIWQWVVAGVLTAVASALIAAVIGTPNMEEMPIQDLLNSRFGLAAVGILAVTIGPLLEELVFRGFLMPLLVKDLGGALGVLITAVLFALPHGGEYGWAWQALVPVGFAGAAFGAARLYTGSTGVATIMHAIYNLTTFSALLAQLGAQR